MRITYLATEPLVDASGISRKIRGQVATWDGYGHDVELVAFDAAVRGGDILTHARRLYERVARGKPDIVYFRQNLFVPGFRRLASNVPVVMELNSDDLEELSNRRGPFRAYHRATRQLLFGSVAGVVTPTAELASRPSIAHFDKPTAVIPNGIDLDASPWFPAPDNERPRVLFTYSSPGSWPGVDLALEAARLLPEFEFDIVGPVPGDGPTAGNVTLHGPLVGDAYDAVVACADVGIASLGMHRIGLREGCTLKLRGYLASGIPAILSYRDADFPDGAPFLLQLPPGEASVRSSVDRIRGFITSQVGQRVRRSDITHLGAIEKERRRLAFMHDRREAWRRSG